MIREENTIKVDIIIPIYNAYDCLSECIDSVIKNTNLKENNLILINDQSTDSRVGGLLNKNHKTYPNIQVLTNKKNLGFVGTVNRGMKLSQNDVLLLNSDTVVTKGWLDKIKDCAYSREMVATVTPLSNNATLASVPKIFEENELPKGMSIEEMGKLVEKCSNKEYPEIPTGHGFCLYLKREALNQAGYFDEEAFGKGYGEENDFCFRTFDLGFRHLLCDDTYIYHKESQSFSERKEELKKNAEKILEQRYPHYENVLKGWLGVRPIKHIGENIAFEMAEKIGKKNILILIHDWKNVSENVGGTTLHTYDLIQNLRDKFNFHVLAPEDGIYKLYSYWSNTQNTVNLPSFYQFADFGFYNSKYKEMLDEVIRDYGISAIHIHHMKGHYFDVVDLAEEYRLSLFFSIHDYYPVCPIINKLYKGKTYCETPTEKQCKECLNNSLCLNQNQSVIHNWRIAWKRLFSVSTKIFAPSTSAKEEVLKTYKGFKISVIEHGVDLVKAESHLSIKNHETFDIAFIGVMAEHKGRDILLHLAKMKNWGNVRIHLFGSIQEKELKNNKVFINHGSYVRENLPSLLRENNIRLVCLFSICPETYSYTLTESIASGVPVLGINLGAVGERIAKDNVGWLTELHDNFDDYQREIIGIMEDSVSYDKVVEGINDYRIRTSKEMSKDYGKAYDSVQNVRDINIENINNNIKNSDKYFSFVSSPAYPDYSWVFDTLKWKIIDKFKIPKPIKNLYKKLRNK